MAVTFRALLQSFPRSPLRVLTFLIALLLLLPPGMFSSGIKTAHVRTYSRKGSAVVQSHARSAPGTKSANATSREPWPLPLA